MSSTTPRQRVVADDRDRAQRAVDDEREGERERHAARHAARHEREGEGHRRVDEVVDQRGEAVLSESPIGIDSPCADAIAENTGAETSDRTASRR